MQAPDFWRAGNGGWRSCVLAPLGAVYGTLTSARAARPSGWTAPVPVLCIGNVVAGGAGKTQVVLDLAERLTVLGYRPHVLLRGYGGAVTGPHPVDPATDDAGRVGDEALLAAAVAPTWVGADRAASAKQAVEAGADILIMDDGLQNPGLAKTLSFIVIDSAYGIGNGHCIPAGPLREPLSNALARADAVFCIGDGDAAVDTGTLPVYGAETVPAPSAPSLKDAKVIAFAGIGRPDKFFVTLERAGANIVARRAFGDHRAYTVNDIETLADEAAAKGARLITTAKDFVRLPPSVRGKIETFPVALEWKNAEDVMTFITGKLGNDR